MLITESSKIEDYRILFEAIAGYGLGGSSVALFCRVGGGIYTKAADVGADLISKVKIKLTKIISTLKNIFNKRYSRKITLIKGEFLKEINKTRSKIKFNF